MSRRTGGRPVSVNGTVGQSPVVVLANMKAGQMLRVHNPNGNTGAFLAVTYDGTTPVVYGAGTTIAPLSADDWFEFVPNGPVTIISDQSSANYSIMYVSQ